MCPLSAGVDALAALGWESPQEPSRFWESAFAAWSGWPTSEVLPAANAWRAYEAHLAAYKRARDDQRAPRTAVEKVAKRGMPARDAALVALEPVVRAGLERRAGTFLAPAWMLPTHPAMAGDLIGWQLMQFLMGVLAVRWEGELCVCEACTAVFRTRGRKRRAKHCDLCKDHPAKPPLGFGRYGPFDLGAPVPTRAGDRVTARACGRRRPGRQRVAV